MNSDILKLFRLIIERNRLAKIRSAKRSKVNRLKNCLMHKKTRRYSSKQKIESYKSQFCSALDEYNLSCEQLKSFTDANVTFRRYMSKKYKTKQFTDASNHVTKISLNVGDTRELFFFENILKIITDEEINNILLDNEVI
jgi:hypothetical protein